MSRSKVHPPSQSGVCSHRDWVTIVVGSMFRPDALQFRTSNAEWPGRRRGVPTACLAGVAELIPPEFQPFRIGCSAAAFGTMSLPP